MNIRYQLMPARTGPFRPGGPKGETKDPESTPERQAARDLGDHGATLLRDNVLREHGDQLECWKAHIEAMVTRFGKALEHQKQALDENEKVAREKVRQAVEFLMFIFSLATSHFAGWAASCIEARVAKSLLSRKADGRAITLFDAYGYKILETSNRVADGEAIEKLAKFTGAAVQDIMSVGAEQAKQAMSDALTKKDSAAAETARQVQVALNSDPYAGIDPRAFQSIKDTTRDVLVGTLYRGTWPLRGAIADAVFWMMQEPDFGEAWLGAYSRNHTAARSAIDKHFEALRNKWVDEWPFFGQRPRQMNPWQATEFERALWAGHIDGYFGQVFEKFGFKYDDLKSRKLDQELLRGRSPYTQLDDVGDPRRHSMPAIMLRTLTLYDPIIKRLKDLNVVMAETAKGRAEQRARLAKREANADATVTVADAIDTLDEVRALWAWARTYPAHWGGAVRRAALDAYRRQPRPLTAGPDPNVPVPL